MARGNFRIDKNICVFCGYKGEDNEKLQHIGSKNNPIYLCKKCYDKNKEV